MMNMTQNEKLEIEISKYNKNFLEELEKNKWKET